MTTFKRFLIKQNNAFSALVLTLALLAAVVGLGLSTVHGAANGGYTPDDLTVKQNGTGAWYTYEKDPTVEKQSLEAKGSDIQVLNYTGIASNEYGWWRIENGKVNFKATGLFANEFGYWYVKNGKVQFGYTGYLEGNYYVHRDNGSPLYSDEQGASLNTPIISQGSNVKAVSTNKTFWYISKGKLQTGYTGAKQGTINGVKAWWRVEGGRANQQFNSVAKNEYGWWYFKNGKVDFDYTGVAKNDLGWWRIENGKVNFKFNGVASNEYGSWYLKDGKVDFTYSGAFLLDGTMYVVEKGRVVLSSRITVAPLPSVIPNVTMTCSGAELSWSPTKTLNGKPIDGYEVYVKTKPTARYTKVATVDAKTTSFTYDIGSFVDPTQNPRLFDVRAIQKNSYGIVTARSPETKQSAENNYLGGHFGIAPPDIVSVTENGSRATITFKNVPYASEYVVYYGKYRSDGSVSMMKRAGSAKAEKSGSGSAQTASEGWVKGNQSISFLRQNGYDFVTVQAVYTDVRLSQKSDYDKGFRLDQKSLAGQKILFMGDSLIIGTPYGPSTMDYTISNRVAQQTGAVSYNCAVGGAVLVSDYPRIVNNSILHNQNMLVCDGTHANFTNGKWPTDVKDMTDFDIVVLEGGPNDWSQRVKLGTLNDTDVTTFYGALNRHMELLKDASRKRLATGKERTKVVLVDIFYSPKGDNKNGINLTYADYKHALKAIAEAYADDPDIDVYFYTGHNTVLNKDNWKTETVDQVHMTAYRYGQMGNHLSRFLESLKAKDHSAPVEEATEPAALAEEQTTAVQAAQAAQTAQNAQPAQAANETN